MGSEDKLDSIVLKRISHADFDKRRVYWNARIRTGIRDACAEIVNPWTAESYETLFEEFMQVPGAYKISVRKDAGSWMRMYVCDGRDDDKMKKLAELAKADPLGYNHLEFQIADETRMPDWTKNVRIDFARVGNGNCEKIVSYSIGVPKRKLRLFRQSSRFRRCQYVKGLWVPEDAEI